MKKKHENSAELRPEAFDEIFGYAQLRITPHVIPKRHNNIGSRRDGDKASGARGKASKAILMHRKREMFLEQLLIGLVLGQPSIKLSDFSILKANCNTINHPSIVYRHMEAFRDCSSQSRLSQVASDFGYSGRVLFSWRDDVLPHDVGEVIRLMKKVVPFITKFPCTR